MHVTGTTGIQQEILAVAYLETSIAPSADRVGDFIGYFGGHVKLEGVLVHHFFDIVYIGICLLYTSDAADE